MNMNMNIIRFADLCAQGKAQGQRVFIRADLNVPFDDHGHISEDTRIRASVPCIQMALAAGAAVMVTSHLGRPTEGDFKPEDSLAPVAKRLGIGSLRGILGDLRLDLGFALARVEPRHRIQERLAQQCALRDFLVHGHA